MERETARADSGFYLSMAVVSAVLIFLGFAPSFYLRGLIPAPVPPLTLLGLAHGVTFTLWMLLFIAQIAFVRWDRMRWHREVGVLLGVLFGAVAMLAFITSVIAGRLGHAPPQPAPPLVFMALPLFGILLSIILVVWALACRRRGDWHKRLMLAAVFTFTGPGTGRLAIPLGLSDHMTTISLVGSEILLAIAIAYDWRKYGRLHPAYLGAIIVYVAGHAAIIWAYGSPSWLAFAEWITAG
jgi:hypothetical protein